MDTSESREIMTIEKLSAKGKLKPIPQTTRRTNR